MKKIFLTGCSGFIGHQLVAELLAKGHSVVGFDNLSTGRFDDLIPFFHHPNFNFHIGTLAGDVYFLTDKMRGCDMVWHLGANTIIPGGDVETDVDLKNNVYGTFNVLEAMRVLNVKELIFASTAAVYGDEPGIALNEAFGPLHPISPYGASKLACEAFISSYSHLYGIFATIFRFSNVVGGGMGHGVTYDFIQKLRKTPAELRIWGNGRGHKPYFLVEDCIAGMIAGHGIAPVDRKQCETFNLGSEGQTSVDEVAKIVSEEMKLFPELVHEGGRHGFPGDVPYVNFDTAKIRGMTKWKPSATSNEAVRIAAKRIISTLV